MDIHLDMTLLKFALSLGPTGRGEELPTVVNNKGLDMRLVASLRLSLALVHFAESTVTMMSDGSRKWRDRSYSTEPGLSVRGEEYKINIPDNVRKRRQRQYQKYSALQVLQPGNLGLLKILLPSPVTSSRTSTLISGSGMQGNSNLGGG